MHTPSSLGPVSWPETRGPIRAQRAIARRLAGLAGGLVGSKDALAIRIVILIERGLAGRTRADGGRHLGDAVARLLRVVDVLGVLGALLVELCLDGRGALLTRLDVLGEAILGTTRLDGRAELLDVPA